MTQMRERGMATAEFAATMPAVALVFVAGLTAVATGIDQVRCVVAARLAARALARGDPGTTAARLAKSAAPVGASVSLRAADALVSASVTVVRIVPVAGLSWTVSGSAVAAREGGP